MNVDDLLMTGFWWTNSKGEEHWTSIKYERLSNFCYGCDKLSHTTQVCREEVVMSKSKPGHPMYGPWMAGTWPKPKRAIKLGGGPKGSNLNENKAGRRSWFEIMKNAKEGEKEKVVENSEGEHMQEDDLMEQDTQNEGNTEHAPTIYRNSCGIPICDRSHLLENLTQYNQPTHNPTQITIDLNSLPSKTTLIPFSPPQNPMNKSH